MLAIQQHQKPQKSIIYLMKKASTLGNNGKLFIYHHEKTMVIEDVWRKING